SVSAPTACSPLSLHDALPIFTARPGTVTAIVGRSGSGKTSLVRLVPRFYEPSAGRITLDGVPLQDYRLADLRRQIALVGQRVMLDRKSTRLNSSHVKISYAVF